MPVDQDGAVAAFERERQGAAALAPALPRTPVEHARRIRTGRSSEPVWWVTGHGWTAAVKVVAAADGPLGWDAGAREVAAHRSGLLAALPPGARAPRCLAVLPRADGTTALWLEGVRGPTASHWPFSWYRTAAAGLGRLQGAFAAGLPLPQQEWLNQGSLAQYVADHPCEQVEGELAGRLRCDDDVVAALERLPRTLCHFDLHPRNLIVGDGDGEIVVLDWSSVGVGTVGEDPSTLVAAAVLDRHVAPGRLRELFPSVVAGYADGLRAAGLDVDDEALSRAGGALLVVRLGWVVARRLRSPELDADERAAAQALADVLLELADDAHRRPPRDAVRRSPGAAA